MNVDGEPVARGTRNITTAPSRCRTPSTRSVAKYRSATSPRKNGATIAAIGFTVNGQ